mgnify:CR=1 FL=1
MILSEKVRLEMKRNKIFLVFSIIPTFFILSIATLFITEKLNPEIFFSFFYGFIFPTVNFVLGAISIHYGFEKSDKLFLIIVFGGLVLRLFLMFILIVIALKFLFVSLNSFIFTTFIFYFYYLIVEIFILTQKKNLIIKTKQ